jgi:hypothetical protein
MVRSSLHLERARDPPLAGEASIGLPVRLRVLIPVVRHGARGVHVPPFRHASFWRRLVGVRFACGPCPRRDLARSRCARASGTRRDCVRRNGRDGRRLGMRGNHRAGSSRRAGLALFGLEHITWRNDERFFVAPRRAWLRRLGGCALRGTDDGDHVMGLVWSRHRVRIRHGLHHGRLHRRRVKRPRGSRRRSYRAGDRRSRAGDCRRNGLPGRDNDLAVQDWPFKTWPLVLAGGLSAALLSSGSGGLLSTADATGGDLRSDCSARRSSDGFSAAG